MNTKILIATGLYPPESGGPATYTKLLEERLPARGFEVRVLPFRDVRGLPKALRHLAYFLRCLGLARGTDIVYAQDTVSVGLPAALAALVAGKKFMVRVPGDYAWEQGRQRFGVKDELDAFQKKSYGLQVEFLRVVQRFVVRRARAVVVPSEYIKKIVGGWCNIARVHVVYSSVEPPQPAAVERPGGFLVVTAARRVPWKGIEALERVVAREPSWAFKLAEGLPRAEALGWIKTADVFVLNSTYEGLSHTLIEAMALGTPVIATRVGGNPELITDGDTGVLIQPKDDAALYAALKQIEMHPEAAQTRARKAQERAKDFSIDKAIYALCGLFKTL